MAASNTPSRIASFRFGNSQSQGIYSSSSSSSSFIPYPLLDWKRDDSGRVLLTAKYSEKTGLARFEAKLDITNEAYQEAAIRELERIGRKKKNEGVSLSFHVDRLDVTLAPGSFADDSLTLILGDLLPSTNGTVSVIMTSTKLTDKHLRDVHNILDDVKLRVKPVVDGVELPTVCVDFSTIDPTSQPSSFLPPPFLLPLPTAPSALSECTERAEEVMMMTKWEIPARSQLLPLPIAGCHDLAFTRDGNVICTTYKSGTHIIRPDRTIVRSIGTAGSLPGQYSQCWGVCVSKFPGREGWIYITDDALHRVSVYNEIGDFQFAFGGGGGGAGQLNRPAGICISERTGLIYVADYTNSRIVKFLPSGASIGSFGSPGAGYGQLNGPIGIGLDDEDNVYVAEYSGNRISVFSSDGTFLRVFGCGGGNIGQFTNPYFMHVDARARRIFVGDYGNKRLQIFRLDGTYENSIPASEGNTIAARTDSNGRLAVALHPGSIVLYEN